MVEAVGKIESPRSRISFTEADVLRGIGRFVGNTPLIKLNAVTTGLPSEVEVFGKAEHMNPGGSVKDRAALSMLRAGIRSGELHPGKTLIDASSGNTGIAYAMLCASMGIPMELVIPASASPERLALLRAYGAKLFLTDPMEGMDGAQAEVKSIVSARPSRYFYPDQYNNDANWEAHYTGTAPEILHQTDRRITHFVAGLGTTGTFVGTSRRLRNEIPEIQCISFQPSSPLHSIEGMKHMASSHVPGIYDVTLADEELVCTTEEALLMTQRLAREEGLFVGISAGASVAVAMKLARNLSRGVVVTVLCDGGARYLSHPFWTSENVEEQRK